MKPFFISIVTAPIVLSNYFELSEEEQQKKINPIDSRIVAIGISINDKVQIISAGSEKQLLEEFWNIWKTNVKQEIKPVGFNIKQFDLPFIVTRSYIQNVAIIPFQMKQVLELREHITAFRYGATRGKLTEYASLLGFQTSLVEGLELVKFFYSKQLQVIEKHLVNEVQVISGMYTRAKETNILDISKF